MTTKDKEALPEPKKVKTDKNNINLSRDEFIAKRRKEKELQARLAEAQSKIEAELDAEDAERQKKLEEEGAADLESQGPEEEIKTVKDVTKPRGRPRTKPAEEEV